MTDLQSTRYFNGFSTTYEDYEVAFNAVLQSQEWGKVEKSIVARDPGSWGLLRRFCKLFPGNENKAEIERLKSEERALVSKAQKWHCESSYREYLKTTSLFSLNAEKWIAQEDEDFLKCSRGTPPMRKKSCSTFLESWPNSKHILEVQSLLEDALRAQEKAQCERDWKTAIRTNTTVGFSRFIKKWPTSDYGLVAEENIEKIQSLEEDARKELQFIKIRAEAEEREKQFLQTQEDARDAFSEAKEQNTINAYVKFLTDWPDSCSADDARDCLQKLQNEEMVRLKGEMRKADLDRTKRLVRDKAKAIKVNTVEGYEAFLKAWSGQPESEWARNRLAVMQAINAYSNIWGFEKMSDARLLGGPTAVGVMKMKNRFEVSPDDAFWYGDAYNYLEGQIMLVVFPGRFVTTQIKKVATPFLKNKKVTVTLVFSVLILLLFFLAAVNGSGILIGTLTFILWLIVGVVVSVLLDFVSAFFYSASYSNSRNIHQEILQYLRYKFMRAR